MLPCWPLLLFLSSASGCFDLILQILPERLQDNQHLAFGAGLQVWKQSQSNPPPSPPTHARHKSLDTPHVKTAFNKLMEYRQITLLVYSMAAIMKESGAWIHPPFIFGTRMDD